MRNPVRESRKFEQPLPTVQTGGWPPMVFYLRRYGVIGRLGRARDGEGRRTEREAAPGSVGPVTASAIPYRGDDPTGEPNGDQETT
jgi:hypothetical protein